MITSKKERILSRIETLMKGIKKSNIAYDDVYYNNDVGYVDRQFHNITVDDIQRHGTNWIVINDLVDTFKPLVGGPYERNLNLQLIGFVQALQKTDNLGTLMNSLQKDMLIAMIKDVELNGLCSYLVPRSTNCVDNMIFPYGGFVIYVDITYVTQGFDI
jgi:hypothetical protein